MGWWSAAAKRSMQYWWSVVGESTRASNAGKLMRAGAAAARIPPCPQCSVRCDLHGHCRWHCLAEETRRWLLLLLPAPAICAESAIGWFAELTARW